MTDISFICFFFVSRKNSCASVFHFSGSWSFCLLVLRSREKWLQIVRFILLRMWQSTTRPRIAGLLFLERLYILLSCCFRHKYVILFWIEWIRLWFNLETLPKLLVEKLIDPFDLFIVSRFWYWSWITCHILICMLDQNFKCTKNCS